MMMMAVLLTFLCVTLLTGAFGSRMAGAPGRAVVRRLRDAGRPLPTTGADIAADGVMALPSAPAWWHRLVPASWGLSPATRDSVRAVGLEPDTTASRLLLAAGYRSAASLRIYQFTRFAFALSLAAIPLVLVFQSALRPETAFLMMAALALKGYMLPRLYIGMAARRRQHRLRLSLPDALDLLVVCVEAGMGLNQAIVRVSEELRSTHPHIADEFRLVNLEIRAGRSRSEALRAMGERTGVDDIASLAAMIIQTDKFGTSIAKSLRVHSDALRVERRQRAEEAAAKTTIKLIFPLLFCIFPALFVVILGPAALHLWKIFGEGGPR